MLQQTFLHAEGIGRGTEATLWESGAKDWQAFLAMRGGGRFSGSRMDSLTSTLADSREALKRKDVAFFSRRLPNSEHWRLYEEFAGLTAFVDIETTGLSQDYDDITVVAMHAEGKTRTFVRGKNLDRFPGAAMRYPLIVTFNGASFDLPFLARQFRGFRPQAHIDLRYPLKRLGYSGGLKLVEAQTGIRRPAHLRELDGWDAVRLWHKYERGDRTALDLLLEYASKDVENLVPLARLAANDFARALGFTKRSCMWGGL